MAGINGGAQIRGGNQVGGPNALGLQQDGQGQQAQLIQQLAQKILEMLQQGGGQQGAQAAKGGGQQGGAGEAGAGGESLEEMFKKLVEMMQQNPNAARQALQNPAVAQVVQTALSGGGGGGSVGKA